MLLLLIILFSLTLGTKRGSSHFDIIISISRYDDLSYNILIVYRHTIMHSKTILGYQKLLNIFVQILSRNIFVVKYFDILFFLLFSVGEIIIMYIKGNINNNCLEKGLALMCNCARNAFKPNFLLNVFICTILSLFQLIFLGNK